MNGYFFSSDRHTGIQYHERKIPVFNPASWIKLPFIHSRFASDGICGVKNIEQLYVL